jgi:mono/diheme cytochrome c family protein
MTLIPPIAALLCGLFFPLGVLGQASLAAQIPGQPSQSWTLEQLRGQLMDQEIELADPMYQKKKRFRALELRELLQSLFGERLKSGDYSHLVFEALDGYASITRIPTALEAGGWVAFADLDYPQWEPIGRQQTLPRPFYVIWTGAEQLPKHGYPWPWALATIRLVRFRDQYPAVYPFGAAKQSAAFHGFETFRARCLRCHAMHQQGGQIGPDLNAPRNILDYRSAMMVKEFIRRPGAYRHTKMPNHADLSEKQLNELLEYLWFMRNRPAVIAAEKDNPVETNLENHPTQ